MVLWVNFSKEEYADFLLPCGSKPTALLSEEARLGANHCEMGAWVINDRLGESFLADAVRYHHESADRVVDASPLVRIVFAANALCGCDLEDAEANFKSAKEVFGYDRSEAEALISRAQEQVNKAAEWFDMEIEPFGASDARFAEKDAAKQRELVRAVRDVSLLQGMLHQVLGAGGEGSTLRGAAQGLQVLFDIQSILFFHYDREKNVLVGREDGGSIRDAVIQEFIIPVERQRCLVAKSLSQGTPVDSFGQLDSVELSIIDDQIIRFVGKEGVVCLPVSTGERSVGVIVLGIDEKQVASLSEEMGLLVMFANHIAPSFDASSERQSETDSIQSEQVSASFAAAREVAHEVSNPLGIIKNYLKILGLKLGRNSPAQEEIRIINEEIDRVSTIVGKLSHLSKPEEREKGPVDVNALIEDLIKITHESLLLQSGVEAHLELDSSLPSVMTNKNGLKQVFINLIKNAVEAMPKGGNIRLSSRRVGDGLGNTLKKDPEQDQDCVEITIMDDGPGIPAEIKSRLPEPFISSKGEGHAGLGLSIAFGTIKELDGTMACENDGSRGTTFKIILPIG